MASTTSMRRSTVASARCAPWCSGSRGPRSRSTARRSPRSAAAIASYLVLLGAHARGLAGYWRTPAVLHTPEGRAALGIGDDERVLGLLHLGPPRQEQRPPDRDPVEAYATYLD